jgi:hypothetical protein
LLGWLWEQNNEHRLPLQKAIYLTLLKASGGDFRIGMIANTLILGGLSLAMILTARHRRGRTQLTDAFFHSRCFISVIRKIPLSVGKSSS